MNVSYYMEIFIKLVITVLLLLFYVKISGKSQLAPMSAFDQIGNMIVGAIGGSTLLNREVTIMDSTIFMSIWILILVAIRYTKGRFPSIRELIDGKRMMIMENGKLLTQNLQKANLSISDIEIILHRDGIIGLNKVKNIWFETNGELTIDLRGDAKMSQILIESGNIHEENLEVIEKDKEWLKEELKQQGIEDIKTVACGEWVEGKLWLYLEE